MAATVRGIKWTTAAAVVTALLQVGYTAIMARLLSPAAFGLVAMAGVVLRFGSYFAEMGLGHALVQRPRITPEDIRATFTASLVLGGGVALLVAVLAPLAVFFFKDAAVVPLVRVMALGFVVLSVGTTSTSLLRRELRFNLLAKLEVLAYVLGYGGVGVGCALSGAGVWSLVAASLAQQLLLSLFTYAAIRHSLRPLGGWHHYAPLLGYGSRVSVISFLEFINSNLDTLLIGRLLGPALLGIYNRAFMLLFLPSYFLANSIGKVAFPAFSQIQHDVPRLRRMYLSGTTLAASLLIPTCAGVAIAAPELVRLLLGPGWEASVPVLRVLCVAIPLNLTTMFAGIVADARANLRQKIWLNMQYIVVLSGLFWGLHGYGLVGIAAAVGIGEALRTGLYMRLTRHDLDAPLPGLLAIYGPGLRAALVVAPLIFAASWLGRELHWPLPLLLSIQLLAGAGGLLAVLLRWPPAALRTPLCQALDRLTGIAALAQAHPCIRAYQSFLLDSAAVPAAPTTESAESFAVTAV